MQTENRLNITAGEWRVNPKFKTITCAEGFGIAQENGLYNSKQWEANALLIADAGTTANKCGLLPSELLKQRDELREALEILVRMKKWKDKNGKDLHYVRNQPKAWEQAEAALLNNK